LKGEDIDLILEFIKWPLAENEELAMDVKSLFIKAYNRFSLEIHLKQSRCREKEL